LANNCRFNNTTSEMYFISNINQQKITANWLPSKCFQIT
jgi:hypothetical protein